MRFQPVTCVVLSGLLWFAVGFMLLSKGLNFVVESSYLHQAGSAPALITYVASLTSGSEQAALFLVAVGLFLGFLKGRFVLSKTVKRVVTRILSLPHPIALNQIYTKGYYIILLSMVGLGLSLKWLPVPIDIRGTIDIFVGSALINGALLYFRNALAIRKMKAGT